MLSDGTRVEPGDPALRLHFWNEHIPRMGRHGPTVGWARLATRSLESSLRELAHYLARHPECAEVRVLFGDVRLATERQTERLHRLIRRYGFEVPPSVASRSAEPGTLRRIGDTVLVLLLTLATNPIALRHGAVRHRRRRVYLSRALLEARYGAGAGAAWTPNAARTARAASAPAVRGPEGAASPLGQSGPA